METVQLGYNFSDATSLKAARAQYAQTCADERTVPVLESAPEPDDDDSPDEQTDALPLEPVPRLRFHLRDVFSTVALLLSVILMNIQIDFPAANLHL